MLPYSPWEDTCLQVKMSSLSLEESHQCTESSTSPFLVDLVTHLEEAEFVQHRREAAPLELVDQAPGGETLEAGHLLREPFSRSDPVQVVLHNDVAEDADAAFALQE